jgi:2-(1,2-epoxy-1,2-dihydrophenyl)acetyl-CoA isomerase
MTEAPPVLLSVKSGLARITLNRPEAANGMNVPLLRALHEAILSVHGNQTVRAVILSGNGKNFCAGGDVKMFASKGELLPDYLREATAWLQLAVAALNQLEVPVITVVQGYAAGGGGLGLVCASDFVFAEEGAHFMSGAVRVGMAPDAGSSVTLVQLIGLRRASEMLLGGRTIDASEALEFGLINRVVPADELETIAVDYATQFLSAAPRAIGATKRLIWTGIGSSIADRLPEEARVVSELSGTADSLEGLAAVIERRSPRFGAS